MKTVELQKLARQEKGSIVSGPFGSSIGSRFFVDEGVPVIRGNNLTKGREKFIDDGFVFLTESKAAEFPNCIALSNDIVFTAAGSIGQVGVIPEESKFERYVISNKQLRVRLNEEIAYPMFVYYWLSSRRMVRYLESMNNGGAVPLLNLGIIRKVPIPNVDIDAQRKIASILSAYDDLIENNRRRIQLLEESARLLYKEWFVHFRFPGHEHVKIVNGLPEGWEKGKIKDLGNIVTGKTPSTKVSENFGKDVPFVKTPDMHRSRFIVQTEESLSERGAATQSNKMLPIGTILVACIGARLGVVSLTTVECQTNQQINAIIPQKDLYRHYCLYTAMLLKPRLEAMGGGATMPNVNKTKFQSIPVLIPPVLLLREFESFAQKISDQITKLTKTNVLLTQARDLLLPRLMNGDIPV